ncbi:MAG: hypothetical protein AAF389_04520 [Gemmatimonadota bacterium]
MSAARAAAIPSALASAIIGLAFVVPEVALQPVVQASFFGAAAVLFLGAAGLLVVGRDGRSLIVERAIKTPHWVQLSAQGSLMLFWGWHVRAVYGNLPLLFGQLLFAYGLDALIQMMRDGRYRVGFGPVPIVISINFFLWFKPEFYYWQFVIVALGYAAKSFIHWQRNGTKRHIFNPSSFPLSIFSVVLILTGTTDATYGLEVAQTLFNPDFIYLAVFLVALPGQFLFGVATMTIAAVVTAYTWSALYFGVTGTFFFRDAYIPIAVFLGMHLLFTDPATSPKSEQGRVIYGVLYASFTIALAQLLESTGAPTFYDKLLPIPILNLMVRRIDRWAELPFLRALEPARLLSFTGLIPRHATALLWAGVFGSLVAVGGVGDDHPGQYLPFWEEACEEGSERACNYVVFVQQVYCDRGSGWACNARGITLATHFGDRNAARGDFERACALSFGPGCENVIHVASGGGSFASDPPPLDELPIVIRGSKGAVMETEAEALTRLACERGWSDFCASAAQAGATE